MTWTHLHPGALTFPSPQLGQSSSLNSPGPSMSLEIQICPPVRQERVPICSQGVTPGVSLGRRSHASQHIHQEGISWTPETSSRTMMKEHAVLHGFLAGETDGPSRHRLRGAGRSHRSLHARVYATGSEREGEWNPKCRLAKYNYEALRRIRSDGCRRKTGSASGTV